MKSSYEWNWLKWKKRKKNERKNRSHIQRKKKRRKNRDIEMGSSSDSESLSSSSVESSDSDGISDTTFSNLPKKSSRQKSRASDGKKSRKNAKRTKSRKEGDYIADPVRPSLMSVPPQEYNPHLYRDGKLRRDIRVGSITKNLEEYGSKSASLNAPMNLSENEEEADEDDVPVFQRGAEWKAKREIREKIRNKRERIHQRNLSSHYVFTNDAAARAGGYDKKLQSWNTPLESVTSSQRDARPGALAADNPHIQGTYEFKDKAKSKGKGKKKMAQKFQFEEQDAERASYVFETQTKPPTPKSSQWTFERPDDVLSEEEDVPIMELKRPSISVPAPRKKVKKKKKAVPPKSKVKTVTVDEDLSAVPFRKPKMYNPPAPIISSKTEEVDRKMKKKAARGAVRGHRRNSSSLPIVNPNAKSRALEADLPAHIPKKKRRGFLSKMKGKASKPDPTSELEKPWAFN